MIFTKIGLAVLEVASTDKDTPLLGHVAFTPSGETVALNAKSFAAIEGVPVEVAKRFPVEAGAIWDSEKVLTIEHTREIFRAIEKDTLFKGALECAEISPDGVATVTNGKRTSQINGRVLDRRWLDWRAVLRKIIGDGDVGRGVIVDVKRLVAMAKFLNGTSEFVEVVMDTEKRALVFIGINGRTAQGVVGAMSGYAETEIDALAKVRAWIKKMMSGGKKLLKKASDEQSITR